MTTQEAARPYVSIYVGIETPDAPELDGKPVRTVSWSAHRFGRAGAPIEYVLSAHHPDYTLTTLAEGVDLPAILADAFAWVPDPPAGWLASLRMTAEPDRPAVVAEMAAVAAEMRAIAAEFPAADTALRAYLAKEGTR